MPRYGSPTIAGLVVFFGLRLLIFDEIPASHQSLATPALLARTKPRT